MNTEKREINKKKSYMKPEVTEVRLVPEEAVLSTCKTGYQSGFDTCDAYGGEPCGGAFQAS